MRRTFRLSGIVAGLTLALPVAHRAAGSLVLAGALVLALRTMTAPSVAAARGLVIPFPSAARARRETTAAGSSR